MSRSQTQEAAMVPKAKFAEVDTLAEEQAVVAELVADQQASKKNQSLLKQRIHLPVDVLRSVAAFVIAAADQQTYVLEGHYA